MSSYEHLQFHDDAAFMVGVGVLMEAGADWFSVGGNQVRINGGINLDDEPYAGFVDDLAALLGHTDMEAVLADFGKRTRREDPAQRRSPVDRPRGSDPSPQGSADETGSRGAARPGPGPSLP